MILEHQSWTRNVSALIIDADDHERALLRSMLSSNNKALLHTLGSGNSECLAVFAPTTRVIKA